MRSPELLRRFFQLLLLLPCCLISVSAAAWTALKPEELAATRPASGKSMEAEVLYSKIVLSFDGSTTSKDCYRRIKVYSPHGVESVQKFAIEHSNLSKISRLAARLTKPDGTSFEFSKKDFFETALMKIGGAKWISRRLLLSALAPGDIVEIKWEESWDGWAWFQFVYCQESLPVREFELYIEVRGIPINFAWYNTPSVKHKKVNEGRTILTFADLPAYEAEPDMPPELETRGYVMIAYGYVENNQNQGWLNKAGWLRDYATKQATPNDKIRALADSLCDKTDSNEEKHRKFYAYCQDKIINIDYDESPQSLKERVKRKDTQTAAQVLKNGRGDSMEINFLFAALATAAGTDARIVCLCPKDLLINANISNGWYFSAPTMIAARETGDWIFLNPGNPAQAFGELRWQEEGTTALLSDSQRLLQVTIPSTPARKNLTLRQASVQLAADGTLAGQATHTYSGQAALQWRILHRKDPQATMERELRDEIVARLPGAEVDQIQFENHQTPGKPLIVRYNLKVSNYATVAGPRLFMAPNVFELGANPRYTAEERHQPFFYPYAYQVTDDIRIIIPAGLVANTMQPPKAVTNQYLPLRQNISWQFDSETNTLSYKRDFVFGTVGAENSSIMYIRRTSEMPAEENSKSQILHYYLDERLRFRSSQTIALEPPETAVPETVETGKEPRL